MAWGYLTYTRPLTEQEASDYELRPSRDNPRLPDRKQPIAEQLKAAQKQVREQPGRSAPDKDLPTVGEDR